MKALIDAENYLFTAAAANEYEVEWAPDDWTYLCRHGDAKALFQDSIGKVREVLPDHRIVLAFGQRFSFRYRVWPQYKAKRKGVRRPAGYLDLMKWAWHGAQARGWEVQTLSDVEADDVLGVFYEEGDVIVSIDKDLLTIPGLHLRDGEVREVSRLEADRNFYGQVLTGDSTDGYPGCPNAGPVAAEKLLAGCTTEVEMWQAVLGAYQKKGFDESYAITQARCARILRAGEYDLAASTPLLWSPPVT
jgi:DNA polymerase-1